MTFPERLREPAARLVAACAARGCTVTTAESCTGGLVAAAITAVPGASAVFAEGYVVYSSAAKQRALDVPAATLATHGTISAATTVAMAVGARVHTGADVAIALTGVAGPGGGSAGTPVGLVWLAVAVAAVTPRIRALRFDGDRDEVRCAAAATALDAATAALP